LFDLTGGWGGTHPWGVPVFVTLIPSQRHGLALVPVLFGEGIRYFDNQSSAPVELEDPRVIEGTRVTHLCYRVKRR
jgi:hypothetical protein